MGILLEAYDSHTFRNDQDKNQDYRTKTEHTHVSEHLQIGVVSVFGIQAAILEQRVDRRKSSYSCSGDWVGLCYSD